MERDSYILWYKNHYGHSPSVNILDKYFPVKNQDNEDIPEPTVEEWEKFWREE